jgi:hypothetical protein
MLVLPEVSVKARRSVEQTLQKGDGLDKFCLSNLEEKSNEKSFAHFCDSAFDLRSRFAARLRSAAHEPKHKRAKAAGEARSN